MIIQNGYCKQGDCISCLQRVTILVLDVNGASWSFALDMGVPAFLSPANCPLSQLSYIRFLFTHPTLGITCTLFIWLHRISELEILLMVA